MEGFEEVLKHIVRESYVKQGLQNEQGRKKLIKSVLTHKKLPKLGWDDALIEHVINDLSCLDSNNFMSNCGVGEREGRVFSSLVARRHYQLSHGIGRSGDIAEVQPKAAGSSIIYKLTGYLVAHALEIAGMKSGYSYLVLPMATGMSLVMCLIALKRKNPAAKYVIWPRIDQKSCFKSISCAGLEPLVVENILHESGEIETDVEAVRSLLEVHGSDVLCVLSTTSCFAPRQPDHVDRIASLCKAHNVGHIINNAYGVQCERICKLINRAISIGRVDGVVQSTDKNFMVPVGGAVVMSPDRSFVDAVSSSYPGRASMAPVLDLCITLLSMGEDGYRALLRERERLLPILHAGLQALADKYSLSILPSSRNSISIGLTLDQLQVTMQQQTGSQPPTVTGSTEAIPAAGPVRRLDEKELTFLGSMLYQRSVSGCRVVGASCAVKKVAGMDFMSWGAHRNAYPHSYLTAACSIGIREQDISLFLERLDKGIAKFLRKPAPAAKASPDALQGETAPAIATSGEKAPISTGHSTAP